MEALNENTAKIVHVLSQAVDAMRAQHSVEESIECVSKLLLLKKLLDQQPRNNLRLFSEEADNLSEALAKRTSEKGYLRRNNRTLSSHPSTGKSVLQPLASTSQTSSKLIIDLEKHDPTLEGDSISLEVNFWNRFSRETLQRVMEILDQLNLSDSYLSNANDLGEAYENFLEKYAEVERFRREVYTPTQLCKMLIELILPEQGNSIYDPACGSGELLAAAAKFIQRSKEESIEIAVFGQTPIEQGQKIAKINLMLHGVYDPDIRLGNSVLSPQFVANNELLLFDVVLTNPPFGVRFPSEDLRAAKQSSRFPYGVPPSGSDGVSLYIQHALSSLKATGKAAMILPRGVLFRESEKNIRKHLIEADQIEAVIELAPKLFHSTSIPVVVIVFNKNKTHKQCILLVDASHEYETERGRNHLSPEQFKRIVSTYHNFSGTKFSRSVSIEEIRANVYDLTVDRYVKQDKEEFDITAEFERLHQLDTRQIELEKSMNNHLWKLGIKVYQDL